MPLFENQKINRITIIQKLPAQKVRCRCECGDEFTSHSYSVQTGGRFACDRCQKLQKQLERQIEAAERSAEKNGIRIPMKMPEKHWEYIPAQELPEV